MKPLLIFLSFVLFISVASVIIDPHDALIAAPDSPRVEPTKAKAVVDVGRAKDLGATFEYNEFDDFTSLKSPDFEIHVPDFRMQLKVAEKGKELHRGESVDIVVHSEDDNWQFLKNSSVVMVVDGERITAETVQHDGTIGSDGRVYEVLVFRMDVALLKKCIDAKSWALRIGSYQTTTTPEFRSYCSRFIDLVSAP